MICCMLLTTMTFARATVPDVAKLGDGEAVEKFDWAQVDHQDVPGGVNVAWNWWPTTGEAAVFARTDGKEPVDLNLRTMGPSICSKLTAANYAIVSKIGYENLPKGSYLEMLSAFRPDNDGPEVTFTSRTTADSGPAAQIEGTDPNRALVLAFDSTSVKGKLVRIELNLHLAGHGSVHLGETSLVQYPDAAIHAPSASPPATQSYEIIVSLRPNLKGLTAYSVNDVPEPNIDAVQQSLAATLKDANGRANHPHISVVIRADKSVPFNDLTGVVTAVANAGIQSVRIDTPPVPSTLTFAQVGDQVDREHASALKKIWFCLGVVATALTFFAVGAGTFLFRRLRKRSHERELRRIASLDS